MIFFLDTISLIPRAYIQNQNIFAKVDSNATLYCISTHISSSYTWTRDGSVIAVGMRFSLLIDGVLHIQNVTEQDSGKYECTATAAFPSIGVVTRKVSMSVTVYSKSISTNYIFLNKLFIVHSDNIVCYIVSCCKLRFTACYSISISTKRHTH